MTSKKKIAFSVTAGLIVLVIGFLLFAYYQFTHNFLSFTPQQMEDVQIALKGGMGEAIFSGHRPEVVPAVELKGKTGLDALLAPAPTGNKGQGLIDEYRRDPQKFKRYAEMLDTAMNAKQVADTVLHQDASRSPRTSEPLAMEATLKVDAWGSPFCIIPVGERVAIVSGGPSHLSCDALPLTSEQIAKSNRSLFAGQSDVVVLIALRGRRSVD